MIELTNKLSTAPASVDGTISLSHEQRQQQRFQTQLDSGEEASIILAGKARSSGLHSGDVLKATDGRVVQVVAKKERVLEARPVDKLDAERVARAAYHLASRHAQVQIGTDNLGIFLRCAPDAELAAMLKGLGMLSHELQRAFEPEQALQAAPGVACEAHHEHDHAHSHDHAPHVHGPGCGHEHHHH